MNYTSVADTSLENATGLSMAVLSKAEGIAWCSAFILLSVFIVVGNLLTIVLFARNKTLCKESLLLVINMAFADLMMGALTLLFDIRSLGANFHLWIISANMPLDYFFSIIRTVPIVATLNSAAAISGERFYTIYWPFKHRTLTMRAYRIVICTVWSLTILASAVWMTFVSFISYNHAVYIWAPYIVVLILFICGCNIGIWIKFRHGSVALQQDNRAPQKKRLTKDTAVVSILALLSRLPLMIRDILNILAFSIPLRYGLIGYILLVFNSFVNPVVYALRIPEFKHALSLCYLGREETTNNGGGERRNKPSAAITPATHLITLRTDPNHTELAFEHGVMDTKL